MEDKKEKPTITIETLLEDNKSIKDELETLKSQLNEMTEFNKALLSQKASTITQSNETNKEQAIKNVYSFIKEDIYNG